MSKLIEEIEVKTTGRKYHVSTPLEIKFTEEPVSTGSFVINKQYRFSSRWTMLTTCEEKNVIHMRDNFITTVIHHIYSDLWFLLIQLEKAVYEKDEAAMLSAIRTIRTETKY